MHKSYDTLQERNRDWKIMTSITGAGPEFLGSSHDSAPAKSITGTRKKPRLRLQGHLLTTSPRSLLAVPGPGCDSIQHAVSDSSSAVMLRVGGKGFFQLMEGSPGGSVLCRLLPVRAWTVCTWV